MLFPGIQEKRNVRMIRKNKPESLQVRKRPTKKKKTKRKLHFPELSGCKAEWPEKAFVSFSGSLTLEAAFVLPVALFFLMTLLGFFTVFSIQIKVQAAMENAVSKAAGAAIYQTEAALSSQAVTLWYIEQDILQALAGTPGTEQLDFEGSEVDWNRAVADIRVTYPVKIVTALFPVPSFDLSQRCRRKLWTGAVWGEDKDKEPDKEEMVYVTADGSVYHRSLECTYLKLSTKQVGLSEVADCRNASGEIYRPCELCDSSQMSGTVYITTTGNRYHGSLACRGLKRQVQAVPITEVGEKGPCSRCGKETG